MQTFFEKVKAFLAKWQEKQSHKKLDNPNPDGWTFGDIGGLFLRSMKILMNVLFVLVFLGLVFGAGTGLGYAASLFQKTEVPSKEALLADVNKISGISELRYADGSLISQIENDLLRIPVTSDAISDNVKKAVISTEDENFNSHNGVVPKAVLRATLGSVVGLGSSSGGSTLTQQLIKQQVVGDAPTFSRKASEIIDALALERYMTKDEILTTYLNVSPFGRNHEGHNIAGVEEAAQGIFGVSAKDLSIPQAAFIAGLPQSPITYSPYSADGTLKSAEDMTYGLKRQKDVLYNMYRTGNLSQQDYEKYKDYDISKEFLPAGTATTNNHNYLYHSALLEAQKGMYQYLIERDNVSSNDLKNDETVKSYRELAAKELREGGYVVTTTINHAVYDAMQNAVANFGGLLDDGTGAVETGNVLLDNETGAVLAFVGGRDYAANQNNHAFDTVRSPGSTIKPILAYGIAIDQGLMGSASILSNYPTNFSSGQPIYHVDSKGTAMMNLQEALDYSWNIPAYWTYRTLREKGVDVPSYMKKLGYEIEDYSVESLPLGGGVEVSVAKHTNAYQALANGGAYQENYMISKIETKDGKVVYEHKKQPVQVYSKATASIMQELLRSVINSGKTTTFKSRLSQLNSGLAGADWIGKTGTTNDYGDSWLMLSNPKSTLGAWTGHDDNHSMTPLSSYNNTANYMANLVNAINQADPSIFGGGQRFALDQSVIKSQVLASTGERPGQVNVNGRNISLGGQTVTSYWAKNGAPATTYRFAIGGSDADYQNAWSSILGGRK
ncbi:penicillin-binding protein PBP1B [Streptococcus massiliensis]|uniref:Membrane carboxypeptidase n=1 Tax=Streptococcus massiliensis TaxID=313439 RepID=A0A380KX24_9STRE|nr:penicillin-binding protein PBP1B [Streptococcus massiliensis]SUN76492.1 membrane carboxypeptidase [Streptococcus massiliensis]